MTTTRRQVLTGLFALTTAAACRRPNGATTIPSSTQPDLSALAELERTAGGRIGVAAVNLADGTTVAYNSDLRFALCSTFKTYAAAALLDAADRGAVDLTAPTTVAADDIVVNSPVTSSRVGTAMTTAELCAAALSHSDNTAGNLMLRLLGGPAAVGAFARRIGDDETRLDRVEPDLNSANPGDLRDTTTPAALLRGYRALLAGNALRAGSRDRLETWMRATTTSDKRIRAGLPPGWTSADKTGAGGYATTNDAGAIYGPDGQRAVLVILSDNHSGPADAPPRNDVVAEATRILLSRLGW